MEARVHPASVHALWQRVWCCAWWVGNAWTRVDRGIRLLYPSQTDSNSETDFSANRLRILFQPHIE